MFAREHEHTLNVWLAAALREYGLTARAEQIQPGNRRIDVEVRIGPVVVALEAEHGQSPNKQASAIRDADARLQQGLAQCALAVCYPDNTTEESLPTARLLWSVREPSLAAPSTWHEGDVEKLATVLRLLPAQLGDPDVLAAVLSASLDGAVARLSESQKRDLALTLDLPLARRGANGTDTAAKRALLVIVSAVMFHARLDSHLRGMKDEEMHSTVAAWPPAKAPVCAEAADPIAAFSEAWTLILRLDYKPIFETALAALSSCPHDLALTDAIRESARAALAVVRNIAGLRHDLLGRIFHTVLDSARYDGSFYTTTPAATLLATLAIADDMCDWQDPEAIARLRITDPACGTGTLLMAAAERIRDLAPKGQDNVVEAPVSTSLIEEVLCGYDVNLTATHMAATTLGLLSPTTYFRQMKIGRAFLGVDHLGAAYLGSLEFLDHQPYLIPWPKAAQAVSQIDSGEAIVQAEPADLVIMNPPYTRDSLRHDQFTSAEESKLKAREKVLFANTPVRLSHNGSTFLYLADFLAKEDVGTVAVVLPLVGATNYSTLDIRKYLASRYHIETIVTSHDPQRIYFSENTSIGEMLLICRRWPADTAKPATRVVNLAINPATPATAISVAHAITNAEIGDYGTLQEWPAEKIAAGDWGAVQFLSPYLCTKFADIKSQKLLRSIPLGEIADIGPDGRGIRGVFLRSKMPSIPLGEIADIGPAGQGIRGVFLRSKMPDEEGRMALWQHDTKRTQSMATTADTHIIAKPRKEHLAESYWNQRGTLLLPTRIRLNTVRVLSVRLDTPALGSLWVPCRLQVSRDCLLEWEKALCIYLNSSIGVLAILGDRTNKTPSYPQLSLDDLRKLMVPDFAAIGDGAAALAAVYDAHAEDTLLPLPQMNNCPVRRALDDAVIATLGLDGEMVATIRRSLAMEPSVTGRRYGV